jgi:type II secretory pathway component GspD/PulD (secretin)
MFSCYLSRLIVVMSLILLSCLVVHGQATAEMRIFELQHRSAEEAAEMVRSLLDDDAKIAAHKNTLVVNASPDELAEVAKLVTSYDHAQRMLRVTVEQGNSLNDQNREINASGHVQDGSVVVDVGRTQSENSNVRFSRNNSQIAVHAQDRSRLESRQASQFMVVMEGYTARISVGHSVPFTSQMLYYWRRHPRFIETIAYQHVDTGFEVLPEVIGNMVQLEIRPFMAFLDSQNPDQIVFQELSTQVRIPLGTWYELSASANLQDGLSKEILGGGSYATGSTNSIRLRVDPE